MSNTTKILRTSEIIEILDRIGAPKNLVKKYLYTYIIYKLITILKTIMLAGTVALTVIVSLINIIAYHMPEYSILITMYLLLWLYIYYSEQAILETPEKMFNKMIQIALLLVITYNIIIQGTLMSGVLLGCNAALTLFITAELASYLALLIIRDRVIDSINQPEQQLVAQALLPK